MKPVETTRKVYHFDHDVLEVKDDVIVTEYALTIKVNGEEFATVVCTPEYIEDMVIGFLASERVIFSLTDIEEFYIEERRGFAHVKVKNINNLYQNFRSKRYITSCCGMTRQGFYFVNDAFAAKDVSGVNIRISIHHCFDLTIEERKRQLRAYFSGVPAGLSPIERAEKNRRIVDHLCNWVTANGIIRSGSMSHEVEHSGDCFIQRVS
ncbi:formate dehydrogenase accessory sulfurtransferase FdhD [Alicyclobacillus fastidiosus]|uniref:Formate dehydrogenase accessory sulfurtransferase FdhD n=1 Tax=Alicyclobacillus fastidiosus TaxID=392011 RepID=A0ABY6ZD29_9BACL|nr:formate dehydrogenase accessory sulfurtransferase FdhD [Alicyclobacillus fastidiosus]WAH40693.1 formate dehydrogenase accessory sulfurtransferase FdhD [Alicyclobacillus fastidiosus]GMA62163.1 hypothetical protein GCM10025859_26030 [Alicyclobacillus fastidiosus]